MAKNRFSIAKRLYGRTQILGPAHASTTRLAARAALISAAFVTAVASCAEQLVSATLGFIQVAAKVQDGPNLLMRRAATASPSAPVTPPDVIQVAEAQSEFRQYYGSFDDRDQLARAIFVNGDWRAPEIADLVCRAVSSPTVKGQLLRALVDDGEVFTSPNLTLALTDMGPRQQPEPPIAAAGPKTNPFGDRGVNTIVKSPYQAEVDLVESVYDPFRMAWITPSQNLPAPNANPFLQAG